MERVTMRKSLSQQLPVLNYCSSSRQSYLCQTLVFGVFQPAQFLAGIPTRVEGFPAC